MHAAHIETWVRSTRVTPRQLLLLIQGVNPGNDACFGRITFEYRHRGSSACSSYKGQDQQDSTVTQV